MHKAVDVTNLQKTKEIGERLQEEIEKTKESITDSNSKKTN